MSMQPSLRLVLLWHMHQPDFRDQDSGEFQQPWVYLHALKDYSDMAAHLEAHPGVQAVVNLVPILLDQIDDYADQFRTGRLRDPLLRLLVHEDLDRLEHSDRRYLLNQCFRSNHVKMVDPFTPYKRLRDLYAYAVSQGGDPCVYFSGQYLADLVTWYHLSWTGEALRREREVVARLMARGEAFTHRDRLELFELISEVVRGTVDRYRALAARGQVELTTTPYQHPIGPLLLELDSAREALPDAPFPRADHYPGGRTRLLRHLDQALDSHARRFGARPRGIWPAEGAVSLPFCRVVGEHGVSWVASGEAVLMNSLRKSGLPVHDRQDVLYRPWRVGSAEGPACFFRDDRLSDLIGFEYKAWHGSDAAAHFVRELEGIAQATAGNPAPVVSVILDGENAWEYYPYNAYYFFRELYGALEQHAAIRTTTFSAVLDDAQTAQLARTLPDMVTGSWVYGNLSTWIGSPDKNRAWELLITAKQSYDLVLGSARLSPAEAAAAEAQLAVCEGSDWFWWFGDYNPREAVMAFDRLFRSYLANLYHLLKLPVPPQLSEPVSLGALNVHTDGAMRRAA